MILLQLSENNVFGKEIKRLKGVVSDEKRLLLLFQFGKYLLEDFKKQLLERLEAEEVKAAWNLFFKKFRNKEEGAAALENAKDDLAAYMGVAKDSHEHVVNIFLDNFTVDEEEVPITDIFKVLEHGASDLSAVKIFSGLQNFYMKNHDMYWKLFLAKYNMDIDEMLTASFIEGD